VVVIITITSIKESLIAGVVVDRQRILTDIIIIIVNIILIAALPAESQENAPNLQLIAIRIIQDHDVVDRGIYMSIERANYSGV